ncbi:Rox3-domain-containing protein [Byssothecium circinans]|uniref:Mediator of RNA polymerase II transcription subunit 19 n=1 Tax=Byssothecium circinans TaxID=147558 RepID=A0A6A5TWN1_9PLEO|nr:Rox3-domain-containing protein [Byssothecium circinans]
MSEHIAKRLRTGSYSPGSPPYHHAAKHSETKTLIIHPNTPTSPPYSSMNPNPNGGFASNTTAAASVMTPPSSVIMSQQHSQTAPPSTTTNQQTFPTPASTAGPSHSLNVDSDGDAMMDDGQDDDAVRLDGHRRSDHDRQERSIFAPEGGVAAAKGICGSQLFLGCQSTYEPSRPHASQDLFELYNLTGLARSVARNDPVTGEKTNKLRKSYEGQIKKMQIAGKPKAVKMDRSLTNLMMIPDFEYQAQMTNKEVDKTGLNPQGTGLGASLNDLLNSALAGIGPGELPHAENAKYRQYLGTDEAVKSKPTPAAVPQRIAPSGSGTPNAHTPASRVVRPERTGSKRQYTDVSYQGYGEGYTDDYAESTGGEDNAQGSKRRKLAFEQRSRPVEVGGSRR